ncbi:SDR family NAD(P)-dependent oxidoreductase [Clavibacter michiganensis]|uniref:SDR family NAD(P)-dependent oxidoreductase n=1 Tax=Clavibacter michiganensis TaxID=28447 RepID=UPI001303719E|nr:SDR family NAD(P)-dependent oxidoreductase [Clavibacter michiganensis]KAF0257258.1 2,3-dihydro-2,3-dihydroxybenzoate dehydrogenase [Clavibacter michiganensis subsp. michiganensis]MDO4019270.1 SDR family NAD(P)-dependent oxidoreductase [Clavibacter michiganensis]MDO4029131.1 SDR family NAD(P)-dependent oxidoreductase [Clavibacter michiganensis]MDO4039050.1 SDR family NAD(P)-dependent oxidoreductase [Clavibacter michiganensis]MDO4041506.1 SDR family NAD(P)-dependent oxidoreductase [Clavibacte
MTTIAIVGAGAGLGAAVARRFGAEGFAVALISRSQERVDELARTLADEGITARGYAANVRDHVALAAALDRAAQELGPVEVLQYSPLPQKEFLRPVLETTPGDLVGAFEFSIQAPVAAVHQVLQGMRVLGRGTVLFINGGTAVQPLPKYAGSSIAFAGESAYGQMIHEALAGDGIHVGQLIIPGAIIPGHEEKDPRVLADTLWSMHQERGDFRRFAADMDDE